MRGLALLALCLTGCSLALQGAVGAAVVCDWRHTRRAAGHWGHRIEEANPILGERPTKAQVDAYFVGVIALLAVSAEVLPEWASDALLTVVGIGELATNDSNGSCGSGPGVRYGY